ncbi:MAG: hypothetical protein IPO32_20505 [Crocinitomicaceae bacterium]|nr:hypothetical protein [Crocinitomicaceae bacterium]
MLKFIEDAVDVAKSKGFNPEKICLAGGCFANVPLNQRILELPQISDLFVTILWEMTGYQGGAALYTCVRSQV